LARLYLLRHAKAVWPAPGMGDFDRPLDAAGRADAEAMGAAFAAAGYVAARVLCSTARRARETLEGLCRHSGIDGGRAFFLDGLYTEDAHGYLDLVKRHGSALASLLVIGHNPMTEDVATALAGSGDTNARAAIGGGFPTSGLAVIRFDGGIGSAAPGAGHLEAFLTPADL